MNKSDPHSSEIAPAEFPAPSRAENEVEPRLANIPGREQAEEALCESEKLFAAFMDHLPGLAWMKDIEGRYVYVNERASRLNPYGAGAIGKTDAEIWPAEIASIYRANDDQVITTRKAVQTAEPYLVDGEQCHGLVSKFPILDRDGSVVMVGGVSVDITGRIEAEEALNAQGLRYKTLMETSADAIYVVNERGDLQEANAAFLRERGYTASGAKNLNVADWDAQFTREELQERLRAFVDDVVRFETRHRRKDGSIFDVEVCATGLRVAGQPLYFCVSRDITERKQDEHARHESEERFRQIAENIHEVFWIWTATPRNPRLLYVSPAYEKIWGRSCESLYSSPQSWKQALHPDDKEWVLAEMADSDLGKIHDLTYQIVRPDGSIRWIRDRIFPVRDGRGTVVRFAGIAEDITDNKLAEEASRESETKFRRLLASNITGVIFWTLQGEILDANDLFLNMVGYTRNDLRHGNLSWKNLTPPEYVAADEKAIGELVATGTCAPFEKEYIRKDGSRVCVLIASALLQPQNDTGSSFVMDITDRKKVAERLEHYTHLLQTFSRRVFEVQEKERRHLARELHDEIGQTLTAAKLNLQAEISNGGSETFARLQETIGMLDRLLGQVRKISLDLRPSMLDDLGLVPALRSLLDQQGRRASVGVRFAAENMPKDLDPEVQTTCFRIAQEAITNAVRHADATQIDVDLRSENRELRVRIRDDGIGFDVESTQGQTVGLGLIGMKERAILLGGRSKISSSPSKGTTIEVSLPLTFRSERERRHIDQ